MTEQPLMTIDHLSVEFTTGRGTLKALRDVGLVIGRSQVVGLVGESGSGKSTLAYAMIGLLPKNTAGVSGEIRLQGTDLLALGADAMRRLRGTRIAMIFQDPMTALNPVFTIATQLIDAQRRRHGDMARSALKARAEAMLSRVGISDARARMSQYPHELSGGMRQRVVIAMALLTEPELLIADEPTTALDVTIEAQIVELLKDLRSEISGSMVLVSHSLGLISELCDSVAVMYAGKIVETAATRDLFADPRHPYTQALLACEIDPTAAPGAELVTIKGELPNLVDVPAGCIFAARCPLRFEKCIEEPPLMKAGMAGAAEHKAACWLA
jgi:peptide/nickel transport system ATP-binding protein